MRISDWSSDVCSSDLRVAFSQKVTATLEAEPLVALARGEIDALPPEAWDSVIVATGPLTSPALGKAIGAVSGEDYPAFFDAIAPIVYNESIDFTKASFQ